MKKIILSLLLLMSLTTYSYAIDYKVMIFTADEIDEKDRESVKPFSELTKNIKKDLFLNLGLYWVHI